MKIDRPLSIVIHLGLGLAIVFGIVKQHGGTLTVTSELNRETTFRILLPRVHAAPQEVAAPRAPRRTTTAGRTVLLVEDMEPVRKMIRMALDMKGYRVLEAPDGENFIQKPFTADVLLQTLSRNFRE